MAHVRAGSSADLYRGLGACHATDRGLQLLLVRLVARGRTSEVLAGDDASLHLDRFFRRIDLGGDAEHEAAALSGDTRRLASAYCEGVNDVLARRVPWELRILGYRPEPWTIADIILMSRVVGYVALAQSQGDVERLALEMARAGVPQAHLAELCPGLVDDLDRDLVGRFGDEATLFRLAAQLEAARPWIGRRPTIAA